MEFISKLAPQTRVIFTAWGCEAEAAAVEDAGGVVFFCDISPESLDADICHLKELIAGGAQVFITHRDSDAAQLARSEGLQVHILEQAERELPQVQGAEAVCAPGFYDVLRVQPWQTVDNVCNELTAAGIEWERIAPVYDGRAFRFAAPPDGQYPYYMLYLDGAESLSRQCIRIVGK